MCICRGTEEVGFYMSPDDLRIMDCECVKRKADQRDDKSFKRNQVDKRTSRTRR